MLISIILIVTSFTQILSQTIRPDAVFDPRCPLVDDPNNPTHLPHESSCFYFYICFNRYRYITPCPSGLHWSVEHDRCEWPHLANCDPALLPPLPEWSTTTSVITTPTTTPLPGLNCPLIDNPNQLIFIPDAANCGRYFLCFNGGGIARNCHTGLRWNQELNWCDFASNVSC